MSKLETITIDTPSGSNTMQIGSTNTATINLGASGDTINIPAGATIANAGTATGFGEDQTPAFKAYRTGNFSLPDSTATKIPFNDDSSTGFYDTDSKYDATTNYRFTPGVAGKYLVQAALALDSASNASALQCQIRKNGTVRLNSSVTQDYYNNAIVCGVVVLGTTDYIEVYGHQNSGGALNINPHDVYTYFSAHRLIGV